MISNRGAATDSQLGILLRGDARRLVRAAADFDTDLIARLVQKSIDDIGVVSTWERLVQPVWQYLGRRAEAADRTAASEHVYVQSAMRALSTARRPVRPAPPSVLLACADGELEAFPLEALVASLEESGTSCCVLGARVPGQAVEAAVALLHPAVVVIWSQTRETAGAEQITTVLDAHRGTTVVAAGPGWTSTSLPPPVLRPTDLSTALVLTLATLESGFDERAG
jgi:MerR family transcriptional regulator, light-induced transcriptional regulator